MPPPDKTRFRISLLQKILLGFVLAFALMFFRSWVVYRNTQSFLAAGGRISHSRESLALQQKLMRDLFQAESSERGYMMTGNAAYLSGFEPAMQATGRDLDELRGMAADDPAQMNIFKQIDSLIQQKLTGMRGNIASLQGGGVANAAALLAKSGDRGLMDEILEKATALESGEGKLLDAHVRSFEDKGRTAMNLVWFGTAAGILILTLGLWWLMGDLRSRRKVEEELAEERNLLSVLIETIPHLVYVKDPHGHYVLDNAAHRTHLGIGSTAELNGKKSQDFFPPEIARIYAESDHRVLHLQEAVLQEEEPGVDAGGNLVWWSTTKVPLFGVDGEVVGMVGVSEDITERKHDEERLRHYAGQMERSNRELEEFASIASHDLQEPLRKIMAFGHRLKTTCGDALGEQGGDYLERMQNAAGRMQTLISDLLTLSRVTSAAQPFKMVDLVRIANDVVSDLEVQIEQTGAEVEVGFLPEIEADPVQMRQLFQNLISNGIKYHRKGEKPHVAICGKIVEMKDYQLPGVVPGEEACKIMVKDNGIGFSKDYAEKIFALFQRLHGRSEYEGTGIGLAVCRKITDRHGGSIVAKSSDGEGATFIVTLPVKQTPENNHEH